MRALIGRRGCRAGRPAAAAYALLTLGAGLALIALTAIEGHAALEAQVCTITGTSGNNTLIGTAGDDVICGLGGNDFIRGAGGNDTLLGGQGNDTLVPDDGDDTADGGTGIDLVRYLGITDGGVTIDLAAGTADSSAGHDTLISIENATGTTFADTITGTDGPNVLVGLDGADTMRAAGGADTLDPGRGLDPIVDGGLGRDVVTYEAAGSAVKVDLVNGITSGGFGPDTLMSIEGARGSAFDDILIGVGGGTTLVGLGGDDHLKGAGGNDNLDGGTNSVGGFDVCLGNGGTDVITNCEDTTNNAPTATDQSTTTNEDTSKATSLAGTDPENDPLTFTYGQPAHGSVTGTAPNVTYKPAANYCGADSFTFTATDWNGAADQGTVSITVTCVNDAPKAVTDSFATIGNTELRVDMVASTAPNVAETTASGRGVLGNDSDPVEGDPVTVTGIVGCADTTAPFDCMVTNQHVVMQSDGRFRYVPAPGATSGTFQYTIADQPAVGVAKSATGTVTIGITDMVWYVNGSAAAGGTGVSERPFNDFGPLDGAGGAGDVDAPLQRIYVLKSTVTDSIELEAGQFLWGKGHGLSLAYNLNGNGSPTVVDTPGDRPTVTSDTNTVTATEALAAEIRGLRLGSTPANAIDVTADGPFSGAGTLTIAGNVFVGAGSETVDVNADAGASGARAIVIESNAWTGIHTGNAIDVGGNAAGATLNVSVSSNNVVSNASGIVVDELAGTINVRALTSNVVSGNTVGRGIVLRNATFDASPSAGFQQVAGGATAVGGSSNGVGASGLQLTAVVGSLGFTGLTIFNDSEAGLFASGAAPGMTLAVGTGTNRIASKNGPALDLNQLAAAVTLTSITSTDSAGTGVNLAAVTGNVTAGSNSMITNAAGADVSITGGSANFTYDGRITDDLGTLVAITQSSGRHDFNGLITDGNDGDGNGISYTINTGRVRFDGGLTLSTGANPAFTATGGGMVVVTDPAGAAANTVVTTSGVALKVDDTAIGGDGLTFQSISSTGAPSGVVLRNTGASDGLTVTGTGGACTSTTATCSGGRILDSTADGISLTNTVSPNVRLMEIAGSDDSGIEGTMVTSLKLTDVLVRNNTNGLTTEHGINLVDVRGTSSVTRAEVTGSTEDNVRVRQTSGVGSIAFSDSTIRDNSVGSGNVGIHCLAESGGNLTCNVSNSTFSGNRTVALRADAGDTSTLSVDFESNVIVAGNPNQGNQGIGVSAASNAAVSFDVSNNRIGTDGVTSAPLLGTGINIFNACGATAGQPQTCTMTGTVVGNTVQNVGAGVSGFGIRVLNSNTATTTVRIEGNTVANVGLDFGLLAEASGTTAAGRLNISLIGNNVSSLGGALDAMRIQSRNTSTVCARSLGANVSSGAGVGFFQLFARQADTSLFQMEGLAPGAQTDAAAEAFLEGANPAISAAAVDTVVAAGGSFTGVAAGSCGAIP